MKANKNNDWYINGIKTQDRVVLKALGTDFFPMIKDYVLKNSGNHEDAEDLFCEVIEVLYRKVQKGTLTLSCKLSTYLFAVAENLWRKKLRHKKYDSEVTIDDPTIYKEVEKLEELMEKTEEYKLMREKFQVLSEDCRKILNLSWYSDLSGKEIADRLNWTHGYLRKRKHKCREKLIELVKKDPRFLELKAS